MRTLVISANGLEEHSDDFKRDVPLRYILASICVDLIGRPYY